MKRPSAIKTREGAIDHCAAFVCAPACDWRAPKRDEFIALIDDLLSSPASAFPCMSWLAHDLALRHSPRDA
jgi:hypothetical protein